MIVPEETNSMQVRPVRSLIFGFLWRTTALGSIYGLLLGGLYGFSVPILAQFSATNTTDPRLVAGYTILGLLSGAIAGLVSGYILGIIDGLLMIVITYFAMRKALRRSVYRRMAVTVSVVVVGIINLLFIYANRSHDSYVTGWVIYVVLPALIATVVSWRINYLIAKWFSDPQGWEGKFHL